MAFFKASNTKQQWLRTHLRIDSILSKLTTKLCYSEFSSHLIGFRLNFLWISQFHSTIAHSPGILFNSTETIEISWFGRFTVNFHWWKSDWTFSHTIFALIKLTAVLLILSIVKPINELFAKILRYLLFVFDVWHIIVHFMSTAILVERKKWKCF